MNEHVVFSNGAKYQPFKDLDLRVYADVVASLKSLEKDALDLPMIWKIFFGLDTIALGKKHESIIVKRLIYF